MSKLSNNKIINDLVNERMVDLNIKNMTNLISKILLKLSSEKLYRNLVYLNINSNIGVFALTYRKKLIYNIDNDISLYDILNDCETREFDNNKYLTDEEYNCIQNEIKQEMCVLNFYVDKLMHNSKSNIESCYQCVCNNIFINKPNSKIWITDNVVAYNFNIIELISLIYNNSDNPATLKKFSVSVKEIINYKYSVYFKLLQIYYENV